MEMMTRNMAQLQCVPMKGVLRLTAAAALAASACFVNPVPAPSAPPVPPVPPSKLAGRAWAATAEDARADIVVEVSGYPDLSPADRLSTKEAKTRYVAETLIRFAERAQATLRRDLASRGVPFRVLWISNSLYVPNADRAMLSWLGARPEVARVDLDVKARGVERTTDDRRRTTVVRPSSVVRRPSSVEWGVDRVHAPEVWAQGYNGQGIVIANLDTGVAWDHPALKSHYRGWDGATAIHNYNWYDPTGKSIALPTDDYGHGTHTAGTAVGDDGSANQIGVAPGARWIACRNMDSGFGSVALYSACFQFALAPTDGDGHNPDPSRAADITSNSWGCQPPEPECDIASALVTATQALRRAGVMVVAAAGNYGGSCATVWYAPGNLDQSLTVGAVNNDDTIAGFSSRGPSTLTGRIKPDLVAPGVGVRSSVPGGNYAYNQGTSMATPHVAGVVALLWSAAPWLRGQIDETEDLLRRTAQPLTSAQTCGGVPGSAVPNNTFGHGLVDARAAVEAARTAVGVSATVPILHPAAEPISFTITASNGYRAYTITQVALTATLPVSTHLVSSAPPASRSGDILSWAIGEIGPSTAVSVTYVVTAEAPGLIVSREYGLSFAGRQTPVTGQPVRTLAFAHRSLLAPVSR